MLFHNRITAFFTVLLMLAPFSCKDVIPAEKGEGEEGEGGRKGEGEGESEGESEAESESSAPRKPAHLTVYLNCDGSWSDTLDPCDMMTFQEDTQTSIQCNILDEGGDGIIDRYQVLANHGAQGDPDYQSIALMSERLPPSGSPSWPIGIYPMYLGYIHASADIELTQAPYIKGSSCCPGGFIFGNTNAIFHVALCESYCSVDSWQNGTPYVMMSGPMFCLWQIVKIPPGQL